MVADDRERWDQRHAAARRPPTVSFHLPALRAFLPHREGTSGEHRGRALDLAGGRGGDAIWLAQQGFDTMLADVAPAALDAAEEAAVSAGVAIECVLYDADSDRFPRGPWDVVHVAHFRHASAMITATAHLAFGGVLVGAIATTTNLERHARPSRRFLADPGDARELSIRTGLEPIHVTSDWRPNGHHECWFVARRSP